MPEESRFLTLIKCRCFLPSRRIGGLAVIGGSILQSCAAKDAAKDDKVSLLEAGSSCVLRHPVALAALYGDLGRRQHLQGMSSGLTVLKMRSF